MGGSGAAPLIFCGLGQNLAASQRYEEDRPYDAGAQLFEYRVMLPCFFE